MPERHDVFAWAGCPGKKSLSSAYRLRVACRGEASA
jgi:hypothetical protein